MGRHRGRTGTAPTTDTDLMTTPELLIADLETAGRVCPQPLRWKELWELLPDRRRAGVGWDLNQPLIQILTRE